MLSHLIASIFLFRRSIYFYFSLYALVDTPHFYHIHPFLFKIPSTHLFLSFPLRFFKIPSIAFFSNSVFFPFFFLFFFFFFLFVFQMDETRKETPELESLHVHEVYDAIADHFSGTRHSVCSFPLLFALFTFPSPFFPTF